MKQYLTFCSESINFGLESSYVREIFPLPELESIAEAPGDVIGLLNLRGHIIPVIHLAKRLGLAQPHCQLSDSMIIMDWQGLQVGLIVNQVKEVKNVAEDTLSETVNLDREQYINTALINGFAQLDGELLTLIHPESVIRQADEVAVMAWEADLNQDTEISSESQDAIESSLPRNFYDFCGSVTTADRLVFASRAKELRAPLESYDISELQPITILSIAGEYFGVELENIREFINLPNLTRIPCAPRYIIGNFNLRGEIVTLMDVSASLELEDSATGNRPKAVIIDLDHQRVGVSVDDVHDVLYLAQEDYLDFPATISQKHQGFLMGGFDYQGSVVRLINLRALLQDTLPKATRISNSLSSVAA